MKSFVIGGLDTPEKKSEAEAILKGLGYESNEWWNDAWREGGDFTFIDVSIDGIYRFHNHDCDQPPITLDELRTMKNQEK